MREKVTSVVLFCFIFLVVVGCSDKSPQVVKLGISTKDSIVSLIKATKKRKNSNLLKLNYAKQALELSKEIKNDSLWFASLDRITILQYRLRDFDTYKKDSERYLDKAVSQNDSVHIAKASFKLGSYYFPYAKYDSAFYHFNLAQLLFSKKGDSIEAGKNLLNMAIIQTSSGDYHGSQETSLKALEYLKGEKNKRYTLSVYNNLGIVSNELKLYSDAIQWYKKSQELITRDQQRIVLFNNMGLTYQKDKQYEKALDYFQKGLQDSKIDSYLSEKATLIDNIGYTYFLQDRPGVLAKIKQAFELRKKQNSKRGTIVSKLHLGEYYFSKGQTTKARVYFKQALSDSEKIRDIKNISKSLLHLSKTVSNNSYIKRYAEINDSLMVQERLLKYQFASIKLATSERELLNLELQKKLVTKNLNLEKQRSRNIILLVISLGLILTLVGGYLYYRQQKRIQHQRHIIETLEARSDEKQQLSMHLHDDIASDLLIGLQRVDLIQKDINNQELEKAIIFFDRGYQKMRKISQSLSSKYFREISFEKRIEKLCHEYSFNNDIHITHQGTEQIEWNHVSLVIKENIYSLVQEAITNVFKHANATSIIISFSVKDSDLLVTVTDNGVGYQNSKLSGLGVQHMRKRTQEISGNFSIKNNLPEKGTTIEILIPNSLIY